LPKGHEKAKAADPILKQISNALEEGRPARSVELDKIQKRADFRSSSHYDETTALLLQCK
jgi:hypothetical protein